MALYTIADLHLSFGSEKPMDVFSGWDNYVDRLKKNWESKVKERDVVVIAGDVSWAMKLEEAKKEREKAIAKAQANTLSHYIVNALQDRRDRKNKEDDN